MSDPKLEHLNPEQRRAVLATEGPLLILAGAGAGKTKTLTERIRHLIHKGVEPSSILAITFTNKAAKEMRERLEKMLREDKDLNRPVSTGERPFTSTFHSLGVHILREHAGKIGFKKHFAIFDRDDSKRAVKEALEVCGLDPKVHDPNRILSIISKEKGRGTTMKSYSEEAEAERHFNIVEQVWREYEKILARDNALDFDDLLLKTRNLLRDDAEVRAFYQKRWRYIHIDEYQDTNKVQYEISRLLVGEGDNICVVGDADQNIYSWRGADLNNILAFEKDYKGAQLVTLEENYRSTKNILDAANAVIKKNKIRLEKNLVTSNAQGETLKIFQGYDEMSEAEFVATKAKELIEAGILPEEIAVLYRANFQSRALEESFLRHDVPYQLLGTKFFARREVKDIISYLRAALDESCLSDIKRVVNVPRRGIGKVTIAKWFSGDESVLTGSTGAKIASFKKILAKIRKATEEMKPSEVILFIIKESGLEEEWKESKRDEDLSRLENAYELANFASRYDQQEEEALLKFLSDAALQSDQDEMKEEVSSVRLMTVHASKGLEFD
ncbi:MAG: UvrD-helicase domain-containing protein, partial [Parcubacteria group bacterium]